MIAVVDKRAEVVWGIGPNPEKAMQDARHWIQWWVGLNPGGKVGKLESVPIRDDANLDLDGQTLFQYCELGPSEQATQLGLF